MKTDVKKILKGFEKVCEYGYIKENKSRFIIVVGNPFMITKFAIPKSSIAKEQVIKDIKLMVKTEKARFKKKFPDTKWLSLETQGMEIKPTKKIPTKKAAVKKVVKKK